MEGSLPSIQRRGVASASGGAGGGVGGCPLTDNCILAETVVLIYKNLISVGVAHTRIPSCSERRFKELLKKLLIYVPYDTNIEDSFKLERYAYTLCGADPNGWNIKKPYYTDVEKKKAVYSYLSTANPFLH